MIFDNICGFYFFHSSNHKDCILIRYQDVYQNKKIFANIHTFFCKAHLLHQKTFG
jgi:hypothetical protein